MNNQSKRQLSSKIAEHFVVIGTGEEFNFFGDDESSATGGKFDTYLAKITDRYPSINSSRDPLPEGLPLFCFPNGIEIGEEAKVPKFHSFVLTSEEGSRMLGCCLIFYEPLSMAQRYALGNAELATKPKLYMPRCICLISLWPFVASFKKFLCGLYQLSCSPCKIPIERYICNFIDDVPAPPAGRVDVTYYMGEKAISFRCPPANEPNVWAGLPLFPLFECLSPDQVLSLIACVLTERQLVFVSSQYSLLTASAEAITSLIYPLTWTHAYIPILPRNLLGRYGTV